MKTSMRTNLTLVAATAVMSLLGSMAFAAGDLCDQEYHPVCLREAQAAVAKAAKLVPAHVKFFNGALIGDGVDALESIAFQVEGQQGLWAITVEMDDCSVFAPAKLLNN